MRLGAVLVIGLPTGFLVSWLTLVQLGESGRTASGWAGLACAAQLIGTVTFARLNWSGLFPSRLSRAGCVATYALVPASYVAGVAHVITSSWRFTGLASGMVAVCAGAWYWNTNRTELDRQLRRPVTLLAPAHAEQMIDSCRRQLAVEGMQPAHRAVVQRNLASALIVGSSRAGGMERLDEATELLTELVQTRHLDPWALALAVRELVLALSVRASRHDVSDGYGPAVQMSLDAAARLPEDTAGRTVRAAAQADLGDYVLLLLQRLEPGTPEFELRRRQAAEAYRAAMTHSRRGLKVRAAVGYAFTSSCAADPSGRSIDEALEILRELEDRRLDHRDRDQVDATIAQILMRRAELVADGAAVEEAARRADRVVRGGRELAGHAALILARARSSGAR